MVQRVLLQVNSRVGFCAQESSVTSSMRLSPIIEIRSHGCSVLVATRNGIPRNPTRKCHPHQSLSSSFSIAPSFALTKPLKRMKIKSPKISSSNKHCSSCKTHSSGLFFTSLNYNNEKLNSKFVGIKSNQSLGERCGFTSDRVNKARIGKRKLTVMANSVPELGNAVDVINNLGLDTLTFLVATVLVIPAFKVLKASPILGFLLSGVVLSQFGLIRNVTDVKALSELGILFLLFEMGLELSIARLKALAKFAFGIGLPQVLLCTLAFTYFELPINDALGTRILNSFIGSSSDIVNIRALDEAIVIGAALSLSSSAFVLQLLSEKGELATKFGSATLGILLLQDLAVIPLLVALPILENGQFPDETLLPLFVTAGLKALLGLGALFVTGRFVLRKCFEIIADTRSPEAFVALCLLTVTGTSLLTAKLGFSDTLGAFLAGALLAETNYRTQVEADIRPFRGLLLGLFFVTTGTSIDFNLLVKEWPNVLALLGGLIAIKTSIITGLSFRSGLSLSESIRTGLLLSQGGEFAFVVFSLANQLGVLPLELNRLLIIVVVLSMGLTPFLDSAGKKIADYIEDNFENSEDSNESVTDLAPVHSYEATEPVVIVGFGQMGQVLASFLSTPMAGGLSGDSVGWPYVSFDLNPKRVQEARKLGFSVLYGDGSRSVVLQTAGIQWPKALMVMYKTRSKAVRAVEQLRTSYPGVPIYARAQDLSHLLELKAAGADDVVLENAETSLRMGSVLLQGLGVMRDDVIFLRQIMRESMDLRAQEALVNRNSEDAPVVGSFQDKVRQFIQRRGKSPDEVFSKQGERTAMDDFSFSSSDYSSDEEDAYAAENGFVNPIRSKNGSMTPSSSSSSPPSSSSSSSSSSQHSSSTHLSASPSSSPLSHPSSIGGNFLESVGGLAAIAMAASPEAAMASNLEARISNSSSVQVNSFSSPLSNEYAAENNAMASPDGVEDKRGVSYCSLDADDDYDGAMNYDIEDGEDEEYAS